MRPDSFADRLLLVLGRRAPGYRWTVSPSGFWATVAATMGRGPDGVLAPKADRRSAAAPAPWAPVRFAPAPVRAARSRWPSVGAFGLGWIAGVATLVVALCGGLLLLGRPLSINGSGNNSQPTSLPTPPTVSGGYARTIRAGSRIHILVDVAAGLQPDLYADPTREGLFFEPLNDNHMVLPPGSGVPDHQACTASDALPVQRVAATVGTTFCLIGPGWVAAVVVYAAAEGTVSVIIVGWQAPHS
jgi:hypothetical protein